LAYINDNFETSPEEIPPDDHSDVLSVNFTLNRTSTLQHDKSSQTIVEKMENPITKTESILIGEKSENSNFGVKNEEKSSSENFSECKVLEMIQACFPDVPRDDLEHVLKNCDFDAQWATNVLLDSGYQMNFTPKTKNTQKCKVDEKSSETPEIPNEPCCMMELSVDMAGQLQQLFGKINDDYPTGLQRKNEQKCVKNTKKCILELLNPQKLKIELSMDLALQLYQAWLNTQLSPDLSDPQVQETEDTYRN